MVYNSPPSLLGQMDTLKATCFQLQIIAMFGLQWSAINPSAYFFFSLSAQFQSFYLLLTMAAGSKTKLLPRFTLKNKKESEAVQACRDYTVQCVFATFSKLPAPCLNCTLLRI